MPFRYLRLMAVGAVLFVAGMLYERGHQQDLCDASGGQWMRAGFCASEVRHG